MESPAGVVLTWKSKDFFDEIQLILKILRKSQASLLSTKHVALNLAGTEVNYGDCSTRGPERGKNRN